MIKNNNFNIGDKLKICKPEKLFNYCLYTSLGLLLNLSSIGTEKMNHMLKQLHAYK